VFANGDTEALARRGLGLVDELDDEARIPATLELLRLQFAARTPDRELAARRVRELADRALDLGLTAAARLGFQTLSFLRWESCSMADAHANIMQAERVSRSAAPEERNVALAQAAKCLVLLERNLGQAEAFVMEAESLAQRTGRNHSAVSFAAGMIANHRGDIDQAIEHFREARQLAREHGERLAEFCAVEHWVMLEIDRGDHETAAPLAEDLAVLGERVRAGAEAPAGRGLRALVQLLAGSDAAADELRASLEELRTADAKYELAYLLTRWAAHDLDVKRCERARPNAEAALEVARAIRRPSETALARVALALCAERSNDAEAREQHLSAVRELPQGELSQAARARIAALLEEA
jgi:tetratricopeptide (TPR) repeat protein